MDASQCCTPCSDARTVAQTADDGDWAGGRDGYREGEGVGERASLESTGRGGCMDREWEWRASLESTGRGGCMDRERKWGAALEHNPPHFFPDGVRAPPPQLTFAAVQC